MLALKSSCRVIMVDTVARPEDYYGSDVDPPD
jgi:hypothetical protein